MAEITEVFCDRCGKKIEYGFIERLGLHKRTFKLINRSCHQEVDLCKNCQRKLVDWFERRNGE